MTDEYGKLLEISSLIAKASAIANGLYSDEQTFVNGKVNRKAEIVDLLSDIEDNLDCLLNPEEDWDNDDDEENI